MGKTTGHASNEHGQTRRTRETRWCTHVWTPCRKTTDGPACWTTGNDDDKTRHGSSAHEPAGQTPAIIPVHKVCSSTRTETDVGRETLPTHLKDVSRSCWKDHWNVAGD